jgi:hypothetical protein
MAGTFGSPGTIETIGTIERRTVSTLRQCGFDDAGARARRWHDRAALRERGYPVVLHGYAGIAHDVSPDERADVRACAALRLRSVRDACKTATR